MITNYLLCGLAVWMVMGTLHRLLEEATEGWAIDLFESIMYFPWTVIYQIVFHIVLLPIYCIWRFFRNAIKGVSVQAWEDTKLRLWKVWKLGCFRLCYDQGAYAWRNKFFLVRIVKPTEKVNHIQ